MQGARILRNEAYLSYVAMTKDEAQRRRWTFYTAVKAGNEQDRAKPTLLLESYPFWVQIPYCETGVCCSSIGFQFLQQFWMNLKSELQCPLTMLHG